MKVLEWAQTPELLFVEGRQCEKTGRRLHLEICR